MPQTEDRIVDYLSVLSWQPEQRRYVGFWRDYSNASRQSLYDLSLDISQRHQKLHVLNLLDSFKEADDPEFGFDFPSVEVSSFLIWETLLDKKNIYRAVEKDASGKSTDPKYAGVNDEEKSCQFSLNIKKNHEHYYQSSIINQLIKRTRKIQEKIRIVSPACAKFVRNYTSRLEFYRALDNQFVSRSPDRCIGATVLVNAHLDSVTDEDLAESLVHEAIHTLLDIDERFWSMFIFDDPWIESEFIGLKEPNVISTWTNNNLPLSHLIHAIFVWYGVLNYWLCVLGSNEFCQENIKTHIKIAVRGFMLYKDLSGELDKHKNIIRKDIFDQAIKILHAVGETLQHRETHNVRY